MVHQTAPTQFVEAKGIRFAYRRFGKASGVPLVFNMHFTGTMDHWDPLVTDGFAKDREVILFDNAGISSSSGEVPTSVEGMAADAVAFIKALGLSQVDALGFSLGGLVAQELTLAAPELVRRLVLVGTGPRSGESMASLTPEAQKIFGATYDPPDHLWLRVFFTPSEASQAAGRAYLKRLRRRTEGRDPEVNEKVAPGAGRSTGQVGRPARKPVRLSKGDPSADAGHQRRQRRDHLHDQLVHPPAEHPRRPADPLPGRQSRLAVPVSGTVCPARLDVPVRGRRVSASRFRIDQSIKETHHEQSFRKDRPRHRRLARHRPRQRTCTGEGRGASPRSLFQSREGG